MGGSVAAGGVGATGGSGASGGSVAVGGSAGDSSSAGGAAGEPSTGEAGQPNAGAAGETGAGGEGGAGLCALVCENGRECDPDYGCVAICHEDVLITSDAELAGFAELRCAVLDGSLTVRSETLTNLSALAPSSLRAIREDLVFDTNPALANIAGLAGIERIDGSLVIMNNAALAKLDGLDKLMRLGSDPAANTLVVSQNPLLEDVAALDGVDSMQVGVVVTGNDRLSSLHGIGRLRATNSVTIANNTALIEFGGLSDLEECGSFLAAGNGLTSLALPSLTRAQSLSITGHPALLAIDLPVLTSVETSLTFASNPVLETVGTLDALESVGTLTVAGNPAFPQCFVDALDARLSACNESCGGNDETATCN
jgi:hypothetical protein